MIKQRSILIIIFISLSFPLFSQKIKISGYIIDNNNKPLPYANIIAKPNNESSSLKFAFSNDDGFYELILKKNESYKFEISILGYEIKQHEFKSDKNTKHDFILKEQINNLDEITIELPINVKEDTITYKVDKFVNGKERKLKNVLKKLPGIEVESNGSVFVNGKKVTKLLVEGKKFFGGGTKLAVNNIPANVLEKIQVLDNYNEVAFLKGISDSDDLAINILLKENKKRFIFGNMELGKGNNKFYRNHNNLFYYSPKTNINLIANLNNLGEKTFTFKDYLNFQGDINSVFKNNGSIFDYSNSDFSQFLESKDIIKNESKFGALNLFKSINKRLDVSSYVLYSFSKNKNLTKTLNQYNTIEESIDKTNYSKDIFSAGKINFSYRPNDKENMFFVTQFKQTNNNRSSLIFSQTNFNENIINTIKEFSFNKISQNFEWHKKISKTHTFSFLIDFLYNKKTPKTNWKTNELLLENLIPIINEPLINLQQSKITSNNQVNLLYNHYWTLNKKNHIYFSIGNKYKNEKYYTVDRQILENGTINDFDSENFNNDVEFQLNDFNFGIHNKFKFNKTTIKYGFHIDYYKWRINQSDIDENKLILLPDFLAKIQIRKSEKIQFKYKKNSIFNSASKIADRFRLQSYNSVYVGNQKIENDIFHITNLSYNKFSIFKGLFFHININYRKKVRGIINEIVFEEDINSGNIDRFIRPVSVSNLESSWYFRTSLRKKIDNKISINFNSNLSTSIFKQRINSIETTSKRNNLSFQLSIKTFFNKFPEIEVGFKNNIGDYKTSNLNSKFISKEPFLKINYESIKNLKFTFDYSKYDYTNKNSNQINDYEMVNANLNYQKEESAWNFRLDINNLLNSKFKQENYFSDYIISDVKTFILPRIIMFTIGYNL
jgi:hypothetical protein